MKSKEEISELLYVNPKKLKAFEEQDPINGLALSGYLCIQSDHRYGMLILLQVENEECEQIIYATPKLHYPFDKNGNYNWPKIDELELYEKLDGTNVLSYHYQYQGDDYVTFKTRLTPILKESKFGNFLGLWKEYTEQNKWIEDVIRLNPDYNLSFELYGSRNPITIMYEVDLEVALLFGVRHKDHAIKPPSQLKTTTETSIPQTTSLQQKPGESDITNVYNGIRFEGSKKNADSLVTEGAVFYVHNGGRWSMFKCKPEEIEKIHWTAGGIPKISLWNTIINAYENTDDPSIEDIIELLQEEYTETQIAKATNPIAKMYKKAAKHMQLKRSINEVYERAQTEGFDIKADKNGTLRWMSQFFEKAQMRKVGSIILKQAGLNKPKFRRTW
jgi:uncharacterized protein (UPF0335 family)